MNKFHIISFWIVPLSIKILDIMTTEIVMSHGGMEANPLMALLMKIHPMIAYMCALTVTALWSCVLYLECLICEKRKSLKIAFLIIYLLNIAMMVHPVINNIQQFKYFT